MTIVSLKSVLCGRSEEEARNDLEKFEQLLRKWAPAQNLISHADLAQLKTRHIMNSWQICPYLAADAGIIDLGAGAGFPGLVLAILGYKNITLLEKNHKKCMFLKEVITQLSLKDVSVFSGRVEDFDFNAPAHVDGTIVSRGFAALETIFDRTESAWHPKRRGVFFKGQSVQTEIAAAEKNFVFQSQIFPDASLETGCLLEISHLSKRVAS